jgi:hypothetical protein
LRNGTDMTDSGHKGINIRAGDISGIQKTFSDKTAIGLKTRKEKK